MDEIGLKDVLYDLLLRFIEHYDAKRGIPRPVSHPDLTARQAAFRCFSTAVRFLWFLTCGLGSGCLLVFWARSEIESDAQFIFLCGAVVAAMVGTAKAMQSFFPYEREDPPVPKPPSPWGETAWLKSTGLAQEYTGSRARGELRLGTLPTGYQLVLPSTQTMRHVAIFGPEGSGKSSTFLCTFVRDWAERGSTIVLDPKGELFEQTASHYRQVYRLDLIDPTRSDYWNFIPDCKCNARLAREIAALIVESHGSRRQSHAQTVWQEIEIDALTAILLHLPHIVEQPIPAMISEFISFRSIDPLEGETESPLTKEMYASPDPQVGTYWRKFAEASRDLQGTILVNLISKCHVFTLSTIKAVTSSLATAGSAQRAAIDLGTLRNPATAIYVSMLEAEADRYVDFLTLLLRLALSVLSTPPPFAVEDAPCLFVFDDAGTVPISGLARMLNRALDSEVAIILAYRNVGEIYKHFGRRDGYGIFHSIKTLVFLPGLDRRTTDVAAGFAGWHTATYWTVRRQGKQSKAEQFAEADLASTYEQALRGLPRHRAAIALVGTAPPIKFMFPPFAWVSPEDRSRPANKGTPYVVDFQTAEAQNKNVDTKPPGSRSNAGQHAEWFQPQTSPGNKIEDERTQRRPGYSTADGNHWRYSDSVNRKKAEFTGATGASLEAQEGRKVGTTMDHECFIVACMLYEVWELTPRPGRSPNLIKPFTLSCGCGNRDEKLAQSRRNFCECLCVRVKARLVEKSFPLSVLLLIVIELSGQRQRSICRNRCSARFKSRLDCLGKSGTVE